VHFNPEQFAEYIESESQAYEELCKTKGLGDRYTK
jgi:tripartite-type tricarboxylate transporter receptor subunit TctC